MTPYFNDNDAANGGGPLSTLRAEFEEATADAHRRCGLSYEFYVRLFSAEAEPLLAAIDPALRTDAIQIAAEFGYYDGEAEPDCGPGVCTLTGIDDYCCPCGGIPDGR